MPGTTSVIVVAAGRGHRAAEASTGPKQYADLAGQPVLVHALAAFEASPCVTSITVVIHADDRGSYEAAIAGRGFSKLAPPVFGGATRQDSVRNGLASLTSDLVLIHDAARPFVTPAIIERVVAALAEREGAIAAVPLPDTLKRAGESDRIGATLARAGLWKAQTPQGFRRESIHAAHLRAAEAGAPEFTDDAAIAEWAGLDVALVQGSERNFKITTPEDMAMARDLMAAERPLLETRNGTGFDVHTFGPGDHVWLAGVRIPHDHGLVGHSDADAPLHALTDALLGAIGDGDIGTHFPPSDPAWKGAPSRLFVEDAARRIAARGGRIVNVDLTILAEAPRIGAHRAAMQAAISAMLGIDAARIGIKATTMEGMGFVGRREGIAALASATVTIPA